MPAVRGGMVEPQRNRQERPSVGGLVSAPGDDRGETAGILKLKRKSRCREPRQAGEMDQIRRKFAEQDAAFPAAAFEVGGQRVIEIARVRVVGSAEARKGVVLFMENRQRGRDVLPVSRPPVRIDGGAEFGDSVHGLRHEHGERGLAPHPGSPAGVEKAPDVAFGGQVEGTARLPVVLEMAPARPVFGIERQEFRFFHKIVLLFPERYHGGEDSSSPAFSIFGESVLPDLTSREAAGIFLTYDTMNGGICNDGKSA